MDRNEALSQLEALAVGTLAQVIPFLRALTGNTLPNAKKQRWVTWLGGLVANSVAISRLWGRMSRHHIDLRGREKAWLKVLAACAFDERYGDKRRAAMKWLRAEPLETEEVALLRLDQADNEGRSDASAQEINDLSFQRLRGLCELASYYRPFVFCFDQTEFYASDPALIKTLGNCIDQFYVDLHNHLTVITANQENWVTEILPHIAPPQQNRIDPELRMEGIRIEGARELITERLREQDLGTDDIADFFAGDWLDQVFILPELGVRALLTRAAGRFRTLARPDKPPPPKQTLNDLFKLEVNSVQSRKALMTYNQDALMWFVKDIGQGLEKVSIGRPENRRLRFVLRQIGPACQPKSGNSARYQCGKRVLLSEGVHDALLSFGQKTKSKPIQG
jgi:hypothetical protein